MTCAWPVVWAGFLVAAAPAVRAQTPAPTFTARADAVRVGVLVTDRGRVVRGLDAGDFDLRDNGVRQQVDVVAFEHLPLRVVLAVDTSDSLDTQQREHLRRAGQVLLSQLEPVDRAAVITFTHRVELVAPLSHDHARLQSALDGTTGSGQTSLVDASYAAMLTAEGAEGRSLVILFTDGTDTTSWLGGEAVLDVARRSDVVVYGVTVGRMRDRFPRQLTDATGGSWIELASTSDLAAAFLRILEEFRERYVLTYTPQGVAEEGWHTLDVRVRGRRVTVQARPGYFNEP